MLKGEFNKRHFIVTNMEQEQPPVLIPEGADHPKEQAGAGSRQPAAAENDRLQAAVNLGEHQLNADEDHLSTLSKETSIPQEQASVSYGQDKVVESTLDQDNSFWMSLPTQDYCHPHNDGYQYATEGNNRRKDAEKSLK